MKNPVERLAELVLNGDSKKALLVNTRNNRRYLTEFPSSEGVLIITVEKAFLLLDSRYAEAGANKAKNCTASLFKDMQESVAEVLKANDIKAVYLENTISYARAKEFEATINACGAEAIIDNTLEDACRELRMIKSQHEIDLMCAAQKITDATFTHMCEFIKAGMTEKEVELEIEFTMKKLGAEGLAFPSIVVSGQKSSMPHGVASDKIIENGDFVTMDTGAMLSGYNSDMTRTVAVGFATDEMKDVYNTVLKAHLEVINQLKPGMVCRDVDKIARDIIDAKYPDTFGHSLGHGVGFDIHEFPRFSKLDTSITRPGMVITDEPGIYIPGKFGVRIEDMLLVTESGCQSLTNSPKELIIL